MTFCLTVMMLYVALKLYFQQNTQTVYNFTGFLNDCQFNLSLFKFQDFNKGKMQNIEDSLESLVSRRLIYDFEKSRKRNTNAKSWSRFGSSLKSQRIVLLTRLWSIASMIFKRSGKWFCNIIYKKMLSHEGLSMSNIFSFPKIALNCLLLYLVIKQYLGLVIPLSRAAF